MSNKLKVLIYFGFSLLPVNLIFFIVSNVVPLWTQWTKTNPSIAVGLWKICTEIDGRQTCEEIRCSRSDRIELDCSHLFVARAFLCSACVACGFSIIFMAMIFLSKEKKFVFPSISMKIFSLLSLLTGIIGVVVAINTIKQIRSPNLKIGVSAILGIIGIVMNFFTSILLIFVDQNRRC